MAPLARQLARAGLRGGDSSPGIRNMRKRRVAELAGFSPLISVVGQTAGNSRRTLAVPVWMAETPSCALCRASARSGQRLAVPVVYTGRRLPSGAGLGNWSCCFGRHTRESRAQAISIRPGRSDRLALSRWLPSILRSIDRCRAPRQCWWEPKWPCRRHIRSNRRGRGGRPCVRVLRARTRTMAGKFFLVAGLCATRSRRP